MASDARSPSSPIESNLPTDGMPSSRWVESAWDTSNELVEQVVMPSSSSLSEGDESDCMGVGSPEVGHRLLHRFPADLAIEDPPGGASGAEGSREETTTTTAGRKLLLDAFTVLLTHNLAKLGRHRYASMRSLSLVSLELCSAYRSLAIVQVRVSSSSVWHKFKTAYRSSRKGRAASRVPMPPRVLRMRWEISLRHLPKRESPAVRVIKWLGRLVRGRCFHPPKDRMVWPRSLQELTFGDRYFLEDGVMEKVVWPPCLKQLSFGDGFNQDIEGVVFPTSLERMYMGLYFDRPIEGVVWPPSLRQLEFGHGFNRPIEKVVWPDSMQELTFGFEFNQSIDRVAWPASLERLAFGRRFDQTIDNIAWPAALKDLQLWANPVEIPHFEGVNTRTTIAAAAAAAGEEE